MDADVLGCSTGEGVGQAIRELRSGGECRRGAGTLHPSQQDLVASAGLGRGWLRLGREASRRATRRLRRRHPRTHKRDRQREAFGDERDQVLSHRAGWDVGEHVSRVADQAILAFGGAEVAALDMVHYAEACERPWQPRQAASPPRLRRVAPKRRGRRRPEATRRAPRRQRRARVRRRAGSRERRRRRRRA